MPDDKTPAYRTPDCILVGPEFAAPKPGASRVARMQAMNKELGPAFGVSRVEYTNDGQGRAFVLPDGTRAGPGGADVMRRYPKVHPHADQDRYTWYVARKEGGKYVPKLPLREGEPDPEGEVIFGYLKDDPHAEVAAAAVAADIDERIAALRDESDLDGLRASASQPSAEFRARMEAIREPAPAASVAPAIAPAPSAAKKPTPPKS